MKKLFLRLKSKDWLLILAAISLSFVIFILIDKFLFRWQSISNTLETLTITLLIAFILGVITNRYFFIEILERVSAANKSSLNSLRLGLIDIHPSYTDSYINYKVLIDNSTKQIDIFAIYSSTWLNSHITDIESFIRRTSGSSLNIVFLDPNSPAIQIFEEKFNIATHSRVNLQQKIDESINTLINSSKKINNSKCSIRLYTQSLPYSYSLFRFDDILIVIPYKHSPGRSTDVPAFIFKKGENKGLFDYFIQDFENIKNNHSKIKFKSDE